jgi:hypothetical protein
LLERGEGDDSAVDEGVSGCLSSDGFGQLVVDDDEAGGENVDLSVLDSSSILLLLLLFWFEISYSSSIFLYDL